jgi:cytidylate kinase
MAIITISRGSYSHGKEIAEKVAHNLGYSCMSRDLILESSKEFNITEIRLIRALEDAPSIVERFTRGSRETYLAFIKATLLEHAQRDNMVYHGLAGHFLLRPVRHVLNVRITANMEDRAKLVMERENVSHEEALRLLKKIDHERKQWGSVLYGIDLWDSSNYDLVINVDRLTVDHAVDTICHAAGWALFKTTPESQAALDELALAASLRAMLLPLLLEVAVTVRNGTVFVKGKTSLDTEDRVRGEIREIADTLPGITDLKIDLDLTAPSFL